MVASTGSLLKDLLFFSNKKLLEQSFRADSVTAEAAAARTKADADSKERAFKAREKEILAELHTAQTALRAKEGKVEELVSRLPAADADGSQT